VSSEEILQRIVKGDIKALKELYDLYNAKVYNTCLFYLQYAPDAEETVQDVFIEIFQSAGDFKHRSTLSTWIYRITVNKCLDKLRYKNRQKRFAFITSIFSKENSNAAYDQPVFDHPGIKLEEKERSVILYNALKQLPENQRTAFILKHMEGLSQKEIAGIMEMGEKAVESLLSRAKGGLRKLLADYYEKSRRK
jgi:RNA polymerase sigma-70 factor (ECF subfamily)